MRVTVPALLIILLSACSEPPREAADPYAGRVKAAQQQATTAFEKEVFKDGRITRAEYEESVSKYIDCMKSKNVDIAPDVQPGGFYQYAVTNPPPNMDSINDSCSEGIKNLIEPLYVDRLKNPHNQDPNDVTAACLVRHKLVPPSYTGKQFREDLADNFRHASFAADKPAVQACLANPAAA